MSSVCRASCAPWLQMVIGGDKHKYSISPDEYVFASVQVRALSVGFGVCAVCVARVWVQCVCAECGCRVQSVVLVGCLKARLCMGWS